MSACALTRWLLGDMPSTRPCATSTTPAYTGLCPACWTAPLGSSQLFGSGAARNRLGRRTPASDTLGALRRICARVGLDGIQAEVSAAGVLSYPGRPRSILIGARRRVSPRHTSASVDSADQRIGRLLLANREHLSPKRPRTAKHLAMVKVMSGPGELWPSLPNEVRDNLRGMRVTPQNVLQIRNALLAEAQLMADKVQRARTECTVGEPGRDPVSLEMAPMFNGKIGALLGEWDAYVRSLKEGAGALGQMAKAYGRTEQEIKDSFSQHLRDNPPPVHPGLPQPPLPPSGFSGVPR